MLQAVGVLGTCAVKAFQGLGPFHHWCHMLDLCLTASPNLRIGRPHLPIGNTAP